MGFDQRPFCLVAIKTAHDSPLGCQIPLYPWYVLQSCDVSALKTDCHISQHLCIQPLIPLVFTQLVQMYVIMHSFKMISTDAMSYRFTWSRLVYHTPFFHCVPSLNCPIDQVGHQIFLLVKKPTGCMWFSRSQSWISWLIQQSLGLKDILYTGEFIFGGGLIPWSNRHDCIDSEGDIRLNE